MIGFPRIGQPALEGRPERFSDVFVRFFREIWEGLGFSPGAPRYVPAGLSGLSITIPSTGPGLTNLSGGLWGYAFDASAEESAFFSVQIPHSYRDGSALIPYVKWAPADATAGDVLWGIEYEARENGDAFISTSTITQAGAASGTAKAPQVTQLASVSDTSLTPGAWIHARIYRDAASASDTYAADAFLGEVGFFCEVEGVGNVKVIPT